MNYLITKRNHPTAEMIYLELVNEIAGLSKTTVYNTLNLFVCLSPPAEKNKHTGKAGSGPYA